MNPRRLDPIEMMSRSDDWKERCEAARLVAQRQGAQADGIVLRLLWDAGDTAVCEAMVKALIESRREAAIPLLLGALGDQPPGDDGEPSEYMLFGLVNAEAAGLPVVATVNKVLIEGVDRMQMLGALEAIVWRAPFRVSASALARIEKLMADIDSTMQTQAVLAYAELTGRKTIAVPDGDCSYRYRLVDPDATG